MNPAVIAPAPLHYDRRSIALHWLTAALVLTLWALGQTIDAFPKGDPRTAARSLHICLGAALALVLAYRIWWRLDGGSRLPMAGTGWIDSAGAWTHKLLYLLLIATVLLGIGNAWARGDSLFNLFKIPSFAPDDKDLHETIEDWHAYAANTLFVVALAHAAAGLFHHYIAKDDVLRRVLPRLSRR
jgi:cytochrome b561